MKNILLLIFTITMIISCGEEEKKPQLNEEEKQPRFNFAPSKYVIYNNVDDEFKKSSTGTFQYNSNGWLTSFEALQFEEDGTSFGKYLNIFSYNDSDKLEKSLLKYTKNEFSTYQKDIDVETINSYNEQGQLIKIVRNISDSSNSNEIVETSTITYFEDKLSKIENFQIDDEKSYTTTLSYLYNEKNLCEKSVFETEKYKNEDVFEYDDNNKLVSKVTKTLRKTKRGSEQYNTKEHTLTYNNEGFVEMVSISSSDKLKYEYQFGSDGNPEKVTICYLYREGEDCSTKTEIFYTDKGSSKTFEEFNLILTDLHPSPIMQSIKQFYHTGNVNLYEDLK